MLEQEVKHLLFSFFYFCPGLIFPRENFLRCFSLLWNKYTGSYKHGSRVSSVLEMFNVLGHWSWSSKEHHGVRVFWVWNQMSATTFYSAWHCKPAVVCGLKAGILSTKVMTVLLSSAVQWEQVHVVKKLLLTWWTHYIDVISTPDDIDPPKRN